MATATSQALSDNRRPTSKTLNTPPNPNQERPMSEKKSLLPTITSSFGMLLGGLLGLYCGSFSESEWGIVIGFALGFVGGAVVGAKVGDRWLARRSSNE